MPRKKVTPELIEKMKELRAQGWPYQKIAAKLGLSVMTVYNHLKKAGKVEAEKPKEEAVEEKKEEEKKEKKGFFSRLFRR
jgi:DNA invertase Pin-like site-specific DNA recombinase